MSDWEASRRLRIGYGIVETEEPEETEAERLNRAARAKAEGNELYKGKDFRGAIGRYTEAIEADPENAMYINNRAAAHLALGNWDAAIDDGRACVACNPRMYKGWKRLATSLLKKGELAEARKAVTQAYLVDTQAFKETEMTCSSSKAWMRMPIGT